MSSPRSSQSSPTLTPAAIMAPLSSSPPRSADTGSSSDPVSRSSPRAPSPLNPHHSKSLTPPSRASLLPTPPPTATRGRMRPFGSREPSPVRDAATATQPVFPIARVASAPAAPQSTPGVSAHLSVMSTRGSMTPPTSAPGLFQFGSRSRSPATSPERGSGRESEGDGRITPASTWWGQRINSPRPWAENSKRKRSIPAEQAEGYTHARTVRLFPAIFLPVLLKRKVSSE
jgi:hypothetical protein